MGVGYQASPLCRISDLEIPGDVPKDTPGPGQPVASGEDPASDPPSGQPGFSGIIRDAPMGSRSSVKADILEWRDHLARKYRVQLGEDLSWDEDSDFKQSADAGVSGDLLLRYVAAVLDQRGPDAARALVGVREIPDAEMDAVLGEANQRGFAGRYPQLLLDAQYWLPFKRHLIIEEPDWLGTVTRFGSAPRLADELAEVRASIAAADPKAAAWPVDAPPPSDDLLANVWQASEIVARLCDAAIAQHLPLWITG